MSSPASTLRYPTGGLGAPNNRTGAATGSAGLPPGTQVFSADNHISLSEDIFYLRFPASMKDQAPRVLYEDGAWTLAVGGSDKGFLPREFTAVLKQYDGLAGAATNDPAARATELASDGVHRELAFPNALLGLMGWPDKEVRGLCFRIYNEYIAELQEQSNGRFYGVGIANWWDGDGCRQSLTEMKDLGLTTFWMPLKPGAGEDGKPIDYSSPKFNPMWEAIEEVGLPVSHHIGEAPLASPCRENGVLVGLVHNAAPFREMFGRYVFGILDRFPGLKVGWFEGGINWVPAALQDCEHLYASAQHMADHKIEHEVAHYWRQHMYASFMVDPLGLEMIDRIGVDQVMWSSDYPHNESTFGYSEQSLANVVDIVGPAAAGKIVSSNVTAFLGLPQLMGSTVSLAPSVLGLPPEPDFARLRTERGARLRAVMAERGVDALILLANANVSYATGATWPLSDAGRANTERPVAVVLVDDPVPHLFTPFLADAAAELGLDDDHLHGPTYLDLDEGVELFAKALADLVPATATVAVDDITGAMHQHHELLFADWPPRAASEVMGPARLVKTVDELACLRRGLEITQQAMAAVQAQLVPGARQTGLTATFLHHVFELGAEANVLDPIWQVMPAHQAELPWTTHGDLAVPLISSERALAQGDVLWVDAGISYGGYHSDFGRTWVVGAEPTARQRAQFERWRDINDAVLSVIRAGVPASDLTAAAMEVCDGQKPWMAHFYLGHGLGLDSAEAPYVGTDLGDRYDQRQVLAAGTVLMIEPVVWDEGHSGYRSENMIVVTSDGCVDLSDYPYEPYGN